MSEGSVTEHSLHVLELQGTKDPLFLHKITFITDFDNDWITNLNFEIQTKIGENIIAACTANSCMMLTFVLRDKKLEQYEKELPLDQSTTGTFILFKFNSALLAAKETQSGPAPQKTRLTE